MSTEFITLNSRLTIKKGTLTEKKVKLNTEEGFTHFISFVALLALLSFCIYRIVVDRDFFFIIQLFLVLIWLQPHLKRIYSFLFISTWRSSIRIDDILKVTCSSLHNGLETEATLHLNNGRKKFLIFRDAENQVDNFIRIIETNKLVSVTLAG